MAVTRVIEIGGNDHIIYPDGRNCKRCEYDGLSTDEKPTEGVHNGDVFLEMDTGKVLVFDEQNAIWCEL